MNIDPNFLIGCVGAAAPEALRLYNLRSQPVFRWSWGYLMFSIPFLIVGGFIAWVLEPSTRWAAFYSGLTAPVLLTTVLKDSAKAQKELEEVEKELNQTQQEREELKASNKEFSQTVKKLRRELEQFRQEIPSQTDRIPPPSPLPIPSVPSPPNPVPAAPSMPSNEPRRSHRKTWLSLSVASAVLIGLLSVWVTNAPPVGTGSSTPSEQPQPDFWQPIIIVAVLGVAIALLLYLRQNRWFKEFLKGI